VTASAGKKDSSASSERVTSTGVPKIVVVEKKVSKMPRALCSSASVLARALPRDLAGLRRA
jgi:hypothetical protein